MPWQLSCRGMCKIVTWLNHCIKNHKSLQKEFLNHFNYPYKLLVNWILGFTASNFIPFQPLTSNPNLIYHPFLFQNYFSLISIISSARMFCYVMVKLISTRAILSWSRSSKNIWFLQYMNGSARLWYLQCIKSRPRETYVHRYTKPSLVQLTHWGRVMHLCIGKLTIIGSDNALLPGQCHAIIWTKFNQCWNIVI